MQAFGNKTYAAEALGCTRQTLNVWIEFYELENAVIEGREGIVDEAENGLVQRIKKQDTTAIIFALKTQGKERGYIERQEVTGKDGNPLPAPVIVRYDPTKQETG